MGIIGLMSIISSSPIAPKSSLMYKNTCCEDFCSVRQCFPHPLLLNPHHILPKAPPDTFKLSHGPNIHLPRKEEAPCENEHHAGPISFPMGV